MSMGAKSALEEAESIVAQSRSLSREAVIERLQLLSGRMIEASHQALNDLNAGTIDLGQARRFEGTINGVAQAISCVRIILGYVPESGSNFTKET